MKMISFELHGSRQSKATGWQRFPGFCFAILADGKRVYGSGDNIPDALKAAESVGADTSEMRVRLRVWVLTGKIPAPGFVQSETADYAKQFENEACALAIAGRRDCRATLAKAARLWRIAGDAARARWAIRHVYQIRGELPRSA